MHDEYAAGMPAACGLPGGYPGRYTDPQKEACVNNKPGEPIACHLCPRKCGVARGIMDGSGSCGMGTKAVVARAMLHRWEEPCISGEKGTGAVFFSGCALRCAYCQNAVISHGRHGQGLNAQELAGVFRRLVEEGAQTLSLITPTHFLPAILDALALYRPPVPLVYNCGGFERVETVKALDGIVDVWLPDLKYVSPRLSGLLSAAPDYFEHAARALRQMCAQSGPPRYSPDGILQRGTLVRHLVLPGCTGDSRLALDFIKEQLPPGTPVSLMGQYTPQPGCTVPGLDRRLRRAEYQRVADYMAALGLPGYIQGLEAADSAFTPAFDTGGLWGEGASASGKRA